MGNRSSMNDCDLRVITRGDFDKFMIDEALGNNFQENRQWMESTGFEVKEDFTCVIDLDDFKVQEYWYASMLEYFAFLQRLGVRGVIEMDLFGSDYYDIHFRSDCVIVHFKELHGDYNEETEEYDSTEDRNEWLKIEDLYDGDIGIVYRETDEDGC